MTIAEKTNKIFSFCGFLSVKDHGIHKNDGLRQSAAVLYCKKKINIEEYKKLLDIHRNIPKNLNAEILMVNLMYKKIT